MAKKVAKTKLVAVTDFPIADLEDLVELARKRGIAGGEGGAVRWAAIQFLDLTKAQSDPRVRNVTR